MTLQRLKEASIQPRQATLASVFVFEGLRTKFEQYVLPVRSSAAIGQTGYQDLAVTWLQLLLSGGD